ncbi:ABC transporter ATP-binding protein [Spirochaetota bacterium]
MTGPVIDVRNIRCGYGSDIIIQNISFGVDQGELIGIIGPNGSGKTTLLRAITKILPLKDGEIFVDGRDIHHLQRRELARNISVVSQNTETGFFTVDEFVIMGRIPYFRRLQFIETHADMEIAEKYMKLTDTWKLKNKLMNELSGGERQLACIARALVQEPKILLLDEPTAHLDITHQVGIMDVIRRLNRELSLTVLIVLHDLNLASEYCKRIMLLSGGTVHTIGSPHEVLTYTIIEKVYKTVVVVKENPVSKKPYVFLVSESNIH